MTPQIPMDAKNPAGKNLPQAAGGGLFGAAYGALVLSLSLFPGLGGGAVSWMEILGTLLVFAPPMLLAPFLGRALARRQEASARERWHCLLRFSALTTALELLWLAGTFLVLQTFKTPAAPRMGLNLPGVLLIALAVGLVCLVLNLLLAQVLRWMGARQAR